MEGSGTKLVVTLVGLALLAGGASWIYQYETTHRATEFWGPEVATLIARPSQVEMRQFEPPVVGTESLWLPGALGAPQDLSRVRGMVHLRRVLFGDKNYVWDQPINLVEVTWRWRLEFAANNRRGLIVLADDFATIGRLDGEQHRLHAANCQPMAETLQQYFSAIGLGQDDGPASTGE
ncbi:MAG: hypothetical protein MK171_01255 [Pirellulales bacterium]|nr:hypothetical protein [Pirellulales bacterium]